MKKTYINPEIEIVKIKAQQLLAGSVTFNGDGTGVVDLTEEEPDDGPAMSRGFGFNEDW